MCIRDSSSTAPYGHSEVYRVYAKSQNGMTPGQEFEFLAALGSYEFHVTVDDGHNGWNNYGEAGWGLLKDGVKVTVGPTRRLASDKEHFRLRAPICF